jgi:hypothetical protein
MIVKAKKSVILVVAQVIELIFYDVCFCVCSLVDALQQIATTLGSKFWKFDAENCKIEMVGLTETPPPTAKQEIECECSPTNDTDCHVVKL